MSDTITRFSYNWNNKLSNNAFTTLRLHNPTIYRVGATREIFLRSGKEYKFLAYAEIKAVKVITLAQINDFIAFLDTGYSAEECRGILVKMYPDVKNWDKQLIDFVLFVKLKQNYMTKKTEELLVAC